ncbi:hypothetical protein H0H92_003332 [Tricholoma furcatifolium]|nr:hypothetical protein H0H92_003332 [Tricholoma furcatifolium]
MPLHAMRPPRYSSPKLYSLTKCIHSIPTGRVLASRNFIANLQREPQSAYEADIARFMELCMAGLPIQKGNNCIDYVGMIVEDLQRTGKTTEKQARRFDGRRNANYDKVSKNTWSNKSRMVEAAKAAAKKAAEKKAAAEKAASEARPTLRYDGDDHE